MNKLYELWMTTGFPYLQWQMVVMWIVVAVLLYLAIVKGDPEHDGVGPHIRRGHLLRFNRHSFRDAGAPERQRHHQQPRRHRTTSSTRRFCRRPS